MPFLNVIVNRDFSAPQKTEFMRALTQAVVDTLGAPVASVRVNLLRIAQEDTMVGGEQGSPLVQIHVFLIVGRTEELKKALLARLNEIAHQCLDVSVHLTRTVIHDMATTDVGLAGGISAKLAGR